MLSKKGERRKVTIDEAKTIFGTNAVFKGELTFKDTLCIDGEFEGKLTTSDNPLGSKLYPKKSKPLAIRPMKVLVRVFLHF